MKSYVGEIFNGEIEHGDHQFYLTEVKSISTGSELSIKQLIQLRDYVSKQKDSFMLTVNDQIPLLLQENEIELLLKDLTQILNVLKSGAEGV